MSLSSGFDMPKSICGRKFSFGELSFEADAAALSSAYHDAQHIKLCNTQYSRKASMMRDTDRQMGCL